MEGPRKLAGGSFLISITFIYLFFNGSHDSPRDVASIRLLLRNLQYVIVIRNLFSFTIVLQYGNFI